jgi:hypothetical protein
MNINLRSVIPTEVRSSARVWSNGVEEPAVRVRSLITLRICNLFAIAAVATILLFWSTAAAHGQGATVSDAQKELPNITAALANNTVASIDILHMPDEVETRASVTPENLERWFDFRITINKAREWAGRDELVRALKSTKASPSPRMADLRSAIVFNSPDRKRIGTLYVGRYFGKYLGQSDGADGAIKETPVKFSGDLSMWIKQMIPSPLQ